MNCHTRMSPNVAALVHLRHTLVKPPIAIGGIFQGGAETDQSGQWKNRNASTSYSWSNHRTARTMQNNATLTGNVTFPRFHWLRDRLLHARLANPCMVLLGSGRSSWMTLAIRATHWARKYCQSIPRFHVLILIKNFMC